MVNDYPQHCSIDVACHLLLSSSFVCGTEAIATKNSLGRVLSAPVFSHKNVPHYPASAVDGYAVSSINTEKATPATATYLEKEFYLWVNTGGVVPDWADSVVMVEDTSLVDGLLEIRKASVVGSNIRAVGEDVSSGQLLSYSGDTVNPALSALFLCAGVERVDVFKKPKILFIPTGNELITQDEWLSNNQPMAGRVVESNSILIQSTLQRWGYSMDIHPIVRDDLDSLKGAILASTENYDLILVGAGSAKGKRDHTATAFSELGEMLFRWLLAKPGRPAMAARVKNSIAVCLPGFAMSTSVVLWSLIFPLIKKMSGFHQEPKLKSFIHEALGTTRSIEAELLFPHSSPQGVEEWLRVQIAKINDTLYTWPIASGASVLCASAIADGIAVLPSSYLECDKGTRITLWLDRNVNLERRLLFQGSDDPALQLLIGLLRDSGYDMVVRSVGSMAGLAALQRGEAHIAASHLLDPVTETYNDNYIALFGGETKWLRKVLFLRQQGFLVPRGNPMQITGIESLVEKQAAFVNRQPGAGTRVLFDYLLQKKQLQTASVAGYASLCLTHLEAANRVASGLADVTLGVKSAADALGLDFIPVAEEPYELIIPKEFSDLPAIKELETLVYCSDWKKQVESMGGYRWLN